MVEFELTQLVEEAGSVGLVFPTKQKVVFSRLGLRTALAIRVLNRVDAESDEYKRVGVAEVRADWMLGGRESPIFLT